MQKHNSANDEYFVVDFLCKRKYLIAMEKIQDVFAKYGVSPKSASKKGLPYCTLWQQIKGMRSIGVRCALRYEKVLGIPRWELRPDLWPAPDNLQEKALAPSQA